MQLKKAGLLAAAILSLVVGCSGSGEAPAPSASTGTPEAEPSPTSEPETLRIYGAVGVSSAHAIVDAETCMAWGDFTALNSDPVQVVIEDASGTVVGVVDAGPLEPFAEGCVRRFDVDIPAGGEFYSATFGDWTSAVYQEAELDTVTMALILDG